LTSRVGKEDDLRVGSSAEQQLQEKAALFLSLAPHVLDRLHASAADHSTVSLYHRHSAKLWKHLWTALSLVGDEGGRVAALLLRCLTVILGVEARTWDLARFELGQSDKNSFKERVLQHANKTVILGITF
jgi:5-hydroxyisourate hydrolase-like protein (transthyretin family)